MKPDPTAAPVADLFEQITAALLSEPSSALITELIAQAEAEMAALGDIAAKANFELLDTATSHATAQKLRADRDATQLTIDRLDVALTRLRIEHNAARAREEDACRCAAYVTARNAMQEVSDSLAVRWPSLAAELRELLIASAEAVKSVEEVNASLPKDALPLCIDPLLMGMNPGEAECVLYEREVELWVMESTGAIIAEEHLFGERDAGGRRRLRGPGPSYRWAVARPFLEITFIPATPPSPRKPLYAAVELPGFWKCTPQRGDPSATGALARNAPVPEVEPSIPTLKRYEPLPDEGRAVA